MSYTSVFPISCTSVCIYHILYICIYHLLFSILFTKLHQMIGSTDWKDSWVCGIDKDEAALKYSYKKPNTGVTCNKILSKKAFYLLSLVESKGTSTVAICYGAAEKQRDSSRGRMKSTYGNLWQPLYSSQGHYWKSGSFPGLSMIFPSKFKDLLCQIKYSFIILYINSAKNFTRFASGENQASVFVFKHCYIESVMSGYDKQLVLIIFCS